MDNFAIVVSWNPVIARSYVTGIRAPRHPCPSRALEADSHWEALIFGRARRAGFEPSYAVSSPDDNGHANKAAA